MDTQVEEWIETGDGWMEDDQKGECTNGGDREEIKDVYMDG
jgi:hypothetical protein